MTCRTLSRSAILFAAAFLTVTARAQGGGPEAIDWLEVGLGFVAGLALFLYGVDVLAGALRELTGGRFSQILERSASNRFKGLASGTVATVALDSSSVVIILLVAIVDAGLIGFAQGLPIILGANIGTTLSSQLFAWDVDRFSPLVIAAGLAFKLLAKTDKTKAAATAVLGVGLILFGLFTIGGAVEPLESDPAVKEWLERFDAPLLGVLAGAVATIVLQSSSAMLGIVIVLAGGGLISLPAGLAMMLGAEIGTCFDTLVASIGRSRAAVRIGLFHLLFNIVTVTIGVLAIEQLAGFARWSASGTGQQIANSHVLFNIAGALLVLPFTGWIAQALERVLPNRADDTAQPIAEAVNP